MLQIMLLVVFQITVQINGICLATASDVEQTSAKAGTRMETYKNLIEKAQNLTLQRDRLQASQVLIRGIQKESKNSVGYRELTKTLESLASLFYSEKAHGLYSSAESVADAKPKEAADVYAEALRLEDSNLSLLKGLARVQLTLLDCSKAESTTVQAEGIDPFSAEVKLLRLQVLSCQKSFPALKTLLTTEQSELDSVQKYVRGLEVEGALQSASESSPLDLKKVKALLSNWESKDGDYPELFFWKWRYNHTLAADEDAELKAQSTPTTEGLARTAALRYMQLCQSLTPRKRRLYELDVRLCRGTDDVDTYLKTSGQTPTPLSSTGLSASASSGPSPGQGLDLKNTKKKVK